MPQLKITHKININKVAYENNDKKMESVYSARIRAGKRRTYFFDVRATRGNDYYLTITESRKRFNEDGYDRHKIFLYKEDFNKFIKGLTESVEYVKTDLMPDYDFDAFNHDNNENFVKNDKENPIAETPVVEDSVATEEAGKNDISAAAAPTEPSSVLKNNNDEEVDKW